jgi:hypothetical protein
MDVIRRARAMLGTAALWGAAWSVPGLVWVGLAAYRDDGLPFRLLSFVRDVLLNWTSVGLIGGSLFALTLSVAERRRSSLNALDMRRVVAWGAIGGAALPLVVIPLVPIVAPEFARQLPAIHNLSAALRQGLLAGTVYGVLGGVCAGASLHLARRADRSPISTSGGLGAVPAGADD